jgi:hypothetical protein
MRSGRPLAPAQPNSSTTTSLIVDEVADNFEAAAIDQSSVLGLRKACVIEKFTFERKGAS